MDSNEKKLLGKKTKKSNSYSKEANKSDGSDNYVFSNRSNSAYTIRHCSTYKKFKEYLNEIENPYYTTDKNFLENSGIFEASKKKYDSVEEIKYSVPLENIDKSKVYALDKPRDFFKFNNSTKTGNFIFSNIFGKEEEKEENLFKNIHLYQNNYYASNLISNFCIDSLLQFQNNIINEFFEINREELFVDNIKSFHYHDFGIGHFYSPKGTGKSILFRSIFVNYINYENDPDRYTPLMFFNIKLLNDLVKKSDISSIKKILLHESYSLFKKREEAKNFIEKINLNETNIMNLINDIILLALDEIKNDQKVFIIDGYSCEYDINGNLTKLIDLVMKEKNFFLQIIYDIKITKDSELLFKNIAPSNRINYNVDSPNKYFYHAKLKLFSEIKKHFLEKEIPEHYDEIFGENVSYFFEYKKDEKLMSFDKFVKQKKLEIKEDILKFCNGNSKYYLSEINNYIQAENKFLYNEIIKYIPANYIDIDITPKPDAEHHGEDFDKENIIKYYSLKYSFPLVKEVIFEILMSRSFIDMKNPEFLKLPGAALGTNFDIEINKIFRDLMNKKYFFEHQNKTQIVVENILEKNEKNGTQIFTYNDVINKIDKVMFEDKKKFEKTDFKKYTCIGVFQNEFCGKAFDILFLTKKNEDRYFNMNLIQVKCSDNFKENKEEELIPQVTYVKHKFSYLLNIEINNIYLSYLSIYQIPKKFAKSNQSRSFLYNIQTDKFVNFQNEEYTEFPILVDSIIYLDKEFPFMNSIINMLCESYHKKIKLIEKEKNINDFSKKNIEEIKNLLNNNELYVYVRPPEFRYYYRLDEFFGYVIKTEPIESDVSLEKIFDIKYKI